MLQALTPASHFKLHFYAAVLRVVEHGSQALGSIESAAGQFPFLASYKKELAEHGLNGVSSTDAFAWWARSLETAEAATCGHLPLRALQETGDLDSEAVAMLLTIGLIEEDARFGLLFDALQGTQGQQRPSIGLMCSWFGDRPLSKLAALGLLQMSDSDVPRSSRTLRIPNVLWDAMRGEQHEKVSSWARFRERSDLQTLHELILPCGLEKQAENLPALLSSMGGQSVIARGLQHNGRRTFLGALARSIGRNALEIAGFGKPDDERWPVIAPLASLLHALPIFVFDLAPGETADLSGLDEYEGPFGIVLGKQGGVTGQAVERALTFTLDLPEPNARRRHWCQALGRHASDLDAITERFRMTGGNIRRAATLALSSASMESREHVTAADVQQASRALNRQTFDTSATRVETFGDWSQLAVAPEALEELDHLESRCRYRERMHAQLGPALRRNLNTGVRALFSGPSGTGKTLAAQLLSARLQMDLYRLDLSTVVNKYIGETEKNLNNVFSRAEELDVILLLDEGDALLTQRTSVQSSNDRYANLETNYLLQRVESFEGILLVTTNAADRIDKAFKRRMDVVIEFRVPEPEERWSIWQMHLPAEHHVDEAWLGALAYRCTLTGGQIRNALLHASALALKNGGTMQSMHLESAVQREYRKMGAICPLRVPG